MKYFVAVTLFASFIAGLRADDFEEHLFADEVPDRHPYVQCKIDLYDCFKAGNPKLECMKKYKSCMAVLIPTVPPFVVACKDKLKTCLREASGFLNKSRCFRVFSKCIINKRPSTFVMDAIDEGVPDRHPYVQCKIDLYDCLRLGNKKKLECLKDYKNCMAVLVPTIPPFVVACKDKLKTCMQEASGFLNKSRCFREFGKCLINKGPSTFVMDAIDDGEPDRHPYVQCKIDLHDCVRLGTKEKLECLKDYKNCMAVLVPTIPPFVVACKDKLKKCLADASGLLNNAKCFQEFGKCLVDKVVLPTLPPFVNTCSDNLMQCVKDNPTVTTKAKCLSAYAKCLKNKGPVKVALDAIEDMGQLEDFNGFVQCQKDFYQCFTDEKDKKKCSDNYKACMDALVPAYVKQCYAKAKECFATASGFKEKKACAKKLGICLRNGAPTEEPVPPAI